MKLNPHPFTLRQLQYIVAVAETLSFRRAAEACHVSQPSLSAQVAQVEDLLGVRLFERDPRSVILTRAGHDIAARAKRMILEADDLVLAGKRASDPFVGRATIGVIPTISPYLLPYVTPHLRAAYPKLTVAWVEGKTEWLVERLEKGTIDAALVALEADLGDVERVVIGRDPFVVILPSRHPLAKGKGPIGMSDLRGSDVLLLDDGHCFRDQALEVCGRAHAHEAELRATSLSTLVQMVAGGNGVTLIPEIAIATETRRASVRVRPFRGSPPYRTIGLIWRKRSASDAALREIGEVIHTAYRAGQLREKKARAPLTSKGQ